MFTVNPSVSVWCVCVTRYFIFKHYYIEQQSSYPSTGVYLYRIANLSIKFCHSILHSPLYRLLSKHTVKYTS